MRIYEIYVDAARHPDVSVEMKITYKNKELLVQDVVMTLPDVEMNKEFFEQVKDRLVEVESDE